jgi:hypothetical protein
MAVIKSGASTDQLSIEATSKAARVTPYDGAARDVSLQSKQTFSIASNFTPAATPTDLVIIEGSATKTLRIVSLAIATETTAAGSVEFFIIKRSAADTTGTFVSAGTPVPHDSANAAATANRVGHFTANPGALGAAVGTINRVRVGTSVLLPGANGDVSDHMKECLPFSNATLLDQPITLRGVAQTLAINFNGAALVAGQVHAYRVVWIEE